MSLSDIARDMLNNPPARVRLDHGLGLAFGLDDLTTPPMACLTLSQVGVEPGPREESIICREFKIPSRADRTTDRVQLNGRWHHIVRYRWPWSPQLELSVSA